MLSKLRPRSLYDVLAAVAFFVALASGTAYAANTIRTGDIVDNEVFTTDVRDDTLGFGGLQSQDLGPGSVGSSEISRGAVGFNQLASESVSTSKVLDGGLIDRDIAQTGGVFRQFNGFIGAVPANNCVIRSVIGVNSFRDHILMTPNADTAHPKLMYGVEYHDSQERLEIKICNPTTASINDGNTSFNLLIIQATG